MLRSKRDFCKAIKLLNIYYILINYLIVIFSKKKKVRTKLYVCKNFMFVYFV